MKIKTIFYSLLFCLPLTVCPAYAVDLSVNPLGDGRFTINGAALDGVAGIDLTVNYDSNLLSGPSVIQGGAISGAMVASNTNNPGFIKIAIISTRAFSGSGQVLAINFAGRNGSGGITGITARSIDLKGVSIATNSFVTPEAQQGSTFQTAPSGGYLPERQSTAQPQPAESPTQVALTAATPSIGSISLPADSVQHDTQKKPDQAAADQPFEQYRELAQVAPRAEESKQPEARQKKSEDLKRVDYIAVIERFKGYKGDRNPLILAELFSRAIDSSISQEPSIAAADGTSKVTLKVLLDLKEDDQAPNFASADAKLSSMRSDEATGRWIIELLPVKGTLSASLSILAGSRLLDIPLVTVPLAKSLNFSDKEMAAFTKDYGAGKPLYDLNNDGRHDYLDDYIYAGNLLLAGKKSGGAK